MIGDKKRVVIAEVGAGPVNTIGDFWPGVDVKIHASDVCQQEYQGFWEHHNKVPIIPIEYQDMEDFTYPDEMFDIVRCTNALDHTRSADKALGEIMRICKKGGWVYLRHVANQRSRHGREHRWDVTMEGGECIFRGKHKTFNVKEFGEFKSHSSEEDLDPRAHIITSICQK
jgi:ubiquinone/menaquinone biosynthesis C-methylase UbiE